MSDAKKVKFLDSNTVRPPHNVPPPPSRASGVLQSPLTNIRDTWVHTKKLVRSPDDVRVLTDDLTVEWEGYTIRVKAGYSTDGASIPRLAWRVIGHPWAQYLPAAIVHDILYETEIWDRRMADDCFRDLMAWLDVPAWRRAVMYRAVRTFGGPTWDKHTEASRTIAREYLEIR